MAPTNGEVLTEISGVTGNWTGLYYVGYEASSSDTSNSNVNDRFYRFKMCNSTGTSFNNPSSSTSDSAYENRHSIKFFYNTGIWTDGSTTADPDHLTTTNTYAATTSVSGYPQSLYAWNSSGQSLNHAYDLSQHSWAASSGSGGGSGAGTLSVNPEVTGISFTKTQNYSVQVDFTYNNIRVSPNSPTSAVEYMVIRNMTTGTNVWSEHVSSAVQQPAVRSILLDNSPTGTHVNLFGHGDILRIMHLTASYDSTIDYGSQERDHKYYATGPFQVSFTLSPGMTDLFNLVITDTNPFPDNATRPLVKDSAGNLISDSQGNPFGQQTHDLHISSTPAYYLSCGINRADVTPFANLYLTNFFMSSNGTYSTVYHSRLFGKYPKVFSNFW